MRSCTRWMTLGQRGREAGFASSIQLMRSQKPVEYSAPSGPRRPRGKVNFPFRIASFITPSLCTKQAHSKRSSGQNRYQYALWHNHASNVEGEIQYVTSLTTRCGSRLKFLREAGCVWVAFTLNRSCSYTNCSIKMLVLCFVHKSSPKCSTPNSRNSTLYR